MEFVRMIKLDFGQCDYKKIIHSWMDMTTGVIKRMANLKGSWGFLLVFLLPLMIQKVGCDSSGGLAPSSAGDELQEQCSSCRGDNSTCRVVSGIFSRPQLNVGYNLVAHIPRGACNLTITEIRKSPNHLALQRRDGKFILNGDWRLSHSGEYSGAGTVFQYKRQDLKSLEEITSSGPLYEEIDLMVLYQQPNPVIKYEYLMGGAAGEGPPSPLHAPPTQEGRHGHRNIPSQRPASYIRYPPPPGSSSLLLPQQHPAGSNAIAPFPPPAIPDDHWSGGRRPGGSSEKKFYWKVISVTNCSEPCGGGVQRSIVRCVRAPAGNPVSDRRCSQEGPKPPPQTTRCNVKPCPAEWVIGDWSSCQGECGEGYRTRPLTCQQRISPSLKMVVPEGACLTQKPEVRVTCSLPRPCNQWTTSEWSSCSAECGSGVRTRSISCVASNGHRLLDDQCSLEERPAEISPCNMGPCEGVDWFVSEWSPECTQKCGSGLQTRHVVCSSLNPLHFQKRQKTGYVNYYTYQSGNSAYQNISQYSKKRRGGSSEVETNLIDGGESEDPFPLEEDMEEMEPALCDHSKKPAEERECFSERSCGDHVWFTGPWGECSVTCGTGLKTRQVLCVVFTRGKFKIANEPSQCNPALKPLDREQCSDGGRCPQRWFTTEWSDCSALCGGGLQKRSVSCRSSNWTLPSNLCYDKDRPIERRSCNDHRCTSPPPSQSSSDNTTMYRDMSGVMPSPTSSLISPSQSSTLTHDNRRVSSYPANRPSSREDLAVDDGRPATCNDEYRNCALVVQARLCRYKYYRSVCCSSCHEASAFQ